MSVSLIQLNGQNNCITYENFENQLKSSLEKTCKDASVIVMNKFPVNVSPEVQTDLIVALCVEKIRAIILG